MAADDSTTAKGTSLSQFFVSLVINVVLLVVQVAIFFLINRHYPRIYAPRLHSFRRLRPQPPQTNDKVGNPPTNIVAWLRRVCTFHINETLPFVNVDTYFFLRYLRVLLRVFALSTLICMPILIAVNATGGGDSSGLDILAFGNVSIANTQHRYWAQLLVAAFFIIVMLYSIYSEYANYIKLRPEIMANPAAYGSSLRAATVMIRDVPSKDLASPQAMLGDLPNSSTIHIAKDVANLTKLTDERAKWAVKLEVAEAKLTNKARKIYLAKLKKGIVTDPLPPMPQFGVFDAETAAVGGDEPTLYPGGDTKQDATGEGNAATAQSATKHSMIDVDDVHNEKQLASFSRGSTDTKDGGVSSSDDNGGEHTRVPSEMTKSTASQQLPPVAISAKRDDEAIPADVDGNNVSQQLEPYNDLSFETPPPPAAPFFGSLPSSTVAVPGKDAEAGEKAFDVTNFDIVPEKERPKARLPVTIFGKTMSLPLMGKKVDLVARARSEIERLNIEIESIQNNPQDLKNVNCVFVEFQSQHAAQSYAASCNALSKRAASHIKAAPVTDVDPRDIIWKNLSMDAAERFSKKIAANSFISAIIIFWSVITAFVGCVSNVTYLTTHVSWLKWLDSIPSFIIGILTAYVPSIMLSILISLVPPVMYFAAKMRGCATRLEMSLIVQKQFFIFVFIQEFIVIVLSNSATVVVPQIIDDPGNTPTLLANSIPKASNFYFSYIILKGLTFPAGMLLRIGALIMVVYVGKYLDSTPRKCWNRWNKLPSIDFATTYPTFISLASIAIIYSMVAPFIIVLALVAFLLFYYVYKYMTLQVFENQIDYLGVHFPLALMQTFTGLYFLEIMLCALFFLATNEAGHRACLPQGIIMIVLSGFTIGSHLYMKFRFGKYRTLIPLDIANPSNPISASEQAQLPVYDLPVRSLTFTSVDYNAPVLFMKRPVLWFARDALSIQRTEFGDVIVPRTDAEDLSYLVKGTKELYAIEQGAIRDNKGYVAVSSHPPLQDDVWG